MECPVAVAEQRDSDGMYAAARRGEIEEFTGVNAPYEAPVNPEVFIDSSSESVDEGAWKVMRTLEMLGIVAEEAAGGKDDQEDQIRRRLASLGYI